MPEFPFSGTGNLISTGLSFIFFLFTLVFLFYSVILSYHWFAYATDKKTPGMTLAIYLSGSALCFIIMTSALLAL